MRLQQTVLLLLPQRMQTLQPRRLWLRALLLLLLLLV
jgi:hypothetical protein